MKKNIVTIIAITILAVSPQCANAQFFKKLGKALEKVGKTVEKGPDTETSANSSDASATSDGAKVTNNLPGFTVEYKGVNWQKDFCGVEFVITNNGSQTVRVYYFDKMKAFGADGSQYACRSIVGNSVTSLGNGDFDFEPGVPVKCVFALFDLPEKGTTMSLCQLRTQTHDAKQGYQDRYIEFRNVPVPQRQAAASGPFKGVWTLKGNNIEGKLTLDFYGKSIDGMDAEGKDIKCFGIIYVGYGSGAGIQTDECPITAWKTNGNEATVTYIGGRDGNTYQSVLTYNSSSKKISVSGTKVVTAEGMGECYVNDGLVFSK